MGITLWIHILEGRNYTKVSDDHSWMHRLSDELDALCAAARVTKLSEYFDYTAMRSHYGDEFSGLDEPADTDDNNDEHEDDDEPLDTETELGPGIRGMSWFDPCDGAETMTVLIEAVKSGALSDLDDRETDDLCEELEDCLKHVEAMAVRDGRFHLAVVE